MQSGYEGVKPQMQFIESVVVSSEPLAGLSWKEKVKAKVQGWTERLRRSRVTRVIGQCVGFAVVGTVAVVPYVATFAIAYYNTLWLLALGANPWVAAILSFWLAFVVGMWLLRLSHTMLLGMAGQL